MSSSSKISACSTTSVGSLRTVVRPVDLTIPPHDLIELLRRLHGEAESVLEGSACARLPEKEEESAKQREADAVGRTREQTAIEADWLMTGLFHI